MYFILGDKYLTVTSDIEYINRKEWTIQVYTD